LCEAIAEERWRPPAADVLRAVLGDEPDDARFYDLAEMRRQNGSLLSGPDDHFDWVIPGPAGWDRTLMVIIASLGADMPIALDYRQSRDRPQVLYLGDAGWVVVAPDIETLLMRLGLGV
jgi:hypothetical protein